MEDIKSLLAQPKSVAPMKIVRAKQYMSGGFYKSEFLVMSIGIGNFTGMALTSSMRYASIRDIEIPKGIIDDTKTYYANFTNIRNIKFSDIVEVVGSCPEDVYHKIVNIVTLTMLGYYRLVKDDENFEHFEIVYPMVKLDNPLLMIIKGLYNPMAQDQEAPIELPEKHITKSKEKPKEEEKPNRKSSQDIPSIDSDVAISILEELKKAGAFTSENTMDERIDKIYRVFGSHKCYPDGMLCVANAHNAMFYDKALSAVRKQLTIDKSIFKLYLTLNRFDLEKKFPEIPSDRIYDAKNMIINIYNGYINSNANINETYDIAQRLKESGIVNRNDFIASFKEEAKGYYKDEAEAILAGQSLYRSVIMENHINSNNCHACSFEEKKRSTIENSLVKSFDRYDEVKEILEGITEENANLYANNTLRWSQKDTDCLLDAVVLFSIGKIIGRAGEESFFILDKDNELIRTYFYITPFDSIFARFSDCNVMIPLCKIKTLSDLSSMSDEKKSHYIINGNDPDKLEKILDIYIVRSCSSHISKKFLNKAAELMGINGNNLVIAISKCKRFANVKIATQKQTDSISNASQPKINKVKKSVPAEEVKAKDITDTPKLIENPTASSVDNSNVSKGHEDNILYRFISAARKLVSEKKIPLLDVGKYYKEIPDNAIFAEQFMVSFTSDAFDQVCKLACIKPVDAKKYFADNGHFKGAPIRANSYLTRISMYNLGGIDAIPVNVYTFDRMTFDIPYCKNISNLDGLNEKILEKERRLIENNEKLAKKKATEQQFTKNQVEDLARTQFLAFIKSSTKLSIELKTIYNGSKYYEVPKGIIYETDTLCGFDTSAFDRICFAANLKPFEFKKLAVQAGYMMKGSGNGSSTYRVRIPMVNGKLSFVNVYLFPKKIANDLIKEEAAKQAAETTAPIEEEKIEEKKVETVPVSKNDPIPVGQMESKKKSTKKKEEKKEETPKFDIKGNYSKRFTDAATKLISEKKIPLYPVGACLDTIPNGAIYYGKDMVAFDKGAFDLTCNEASIPVRDAQKELYNKKMIIDACFDSKYSYFTRLHVNIKGQKPLKINVYKIVSSPFESVLPS